MSQPTPEQSQVLDHSTKILRSLDELLAFEPFQAFMERCARETDSMANSILHDEMLEPERDKLRIKRLGWLDVMKAPMIDRETHLGIIQTFERGA